MSVLMIERYKLLVNYSIFFSAFELSRNSPTHRSASRSNETKKISGLSAGLRPRVSDFLHRINLLRLCG